MYNQQVQDNLRKVQLSSITNFTIKNFLDNAQRNKLSDKEFNLEVERFNNTHGMLIPKRGAGYQVAKPNYSYLNYPYLDREAIHQTMDNYRLYVHNYNAKVKAINKEITQYNKQKVKASAELSETEKAQKKAFEKRNNHLFTADYNEQVTAINATNAIIAKKRIPTIKFQTELIFELLLWFYASQLKTNNLVKLNRRESTRIEKSNMYKLRLNHNDLVTFKKNNIQRLDLTKRSVQNHVKRLREAGILINYRFINHQKPVFVNISWDILKVLDGNPPKSLQVNNQLVNQEKKQSFHNSKDCTRTILLKEEKIKDCAISTVGNKCGSMLQENESNAVCPADSYKNTKGISNKIKIEGGQKIQLPQFLTQKTPAKRPQILQQNFLARKLSVSNFAQKLSDGAYQNHKGLPYSYLEKVEQYALVSTEDFKQIVIQDFIKSSAKIWKNHSVYVGEWVKTIQLLSEQLFKNMVNKSTIIQKLKEYRWKLNFARNWFESHKVNALFPYAYFDTTRTTKKEIGFYGLHPVWKKHLQKKAKKAQEATQKVTAANNRKRRLSYQQKLTNAIKKFENGAYTKKQLYDYVQFNLPQDYLLQLTSIIEYQHINLA
ncbi:hypothetical protein [Tenacibaculum geojense]|uniref:Replication protein n=1 Tax=Tenacibaculum geojense TaxID=915352 RepID=A0ABW3JSR6_9FLAO